METQQPPFQAFTRRHPVPIYYVLTFALSWSAVLLAIGPDAFLGTRQLSAAQAPVAGMAMLIGPSITGLLLTGLASGRAGFRELRSRLLTWRIGTRWYAVALLTAPLLILAILFALSLTSRAFLPTIITSNDKVGLLVPGIVAGLAVCFFEELGWTGFVVPTLRKRYGLLPTGLLMGLLWGAWHFPLFWGSARSSGTLPPVLLLIVLLFSFLPVYRVLLVWLYDRTRSLLVVMLMHAPLVASQTILIPALTGMSVVTYDLLFAAALCVAVAAVVMASSRKRLPGEHTHAIPFPKQLASR